MKRPHLLDRVIGEELPVFRTDADFRAYEEVPYPDRIAARGTYEAPQLDDELKGVFNVQIFRG